MKIGRFIYPLIPFVVVVATMEILCDRGVLPRFLFPAPSQIVSSVIDDPASFKTAFFETAYGSSLGLLLSVVIGLSFSFLLAASHFIRMMFYPYATFFRRFRLLPLRHF